jgi:hypothetical protein
LQLLQQRQSHNCDSRSALAKKCCQMDITMVENVENQADIPQLQIQMAEAKA